MLLEVSVRNRSVFPHGHPSVLVHRVGVFPVIAGRRAAWHWNPAQHHGGDERLEETEQDLNEVEGTAFTEAKSEDEKRNPIANITNGKVFMMLTSGLRP